MSNPTLLFVIGGCALGAVQLVAGLALGMWLRRCDKVDGQRGRQDMKRASLIAKRLQQLTDEMSSSASAHRAQLDEATQLLTSSDGQTEEALAELVVDVIGDMVRANQNLTSQLATAEDRLEKQAMEIEAHISRSLTDPLTGLPNRREFNDRLEERMSAWKRRKEVFSLLLLDVDHFKNLNDEHGHLAGDQVLAVIARTIRAAVRREDAVARFGGEEFAVLLPNTPLTPGTRVAEKVRDAVSRAVVKHNNQPLAVTISGGLTAIKANDTVESLIQRADAALYSAKAGGRNRTCVHDGRDTKTSTGPADKIMEMIQKSDGEAHSSTTSEKPMDFGDYLPRDAISPQLAQTCDELRRYVDERGKSEQVAEPAKQLAK